MKNASQTLNRCMESLKIARGDTEVAVYAETKFGAGSFINVKRAFAKLIIVARSWGHTSGGDDIDE